MAHPAKRVTLWFQDEARVGQKGRLCHRWWLKGQRPPGLCDHRFDWTYIFAAAQPVSGDAFALILPEVSTQAMDMFLAEFSKTLAHVDVNDAAKLSGNFTHYWISGFVENWCSVWL